MKDTIIKLEKEYFSPTAQTIEIELLEVILQPSGEYGTGENPQQSNIY